MQQSLVYRDAIRLANSPAPSEQVLDAQAVDPAQVQDLQYSAWKNQFVAEQRARLGF